LTLAAGVTAGAVAATAAALLAAMAWFTAKDCCKEKFKLSKFNF
jgi:hypothetical protein